MNVFDFSFKKILLFNLNRGFSVTLTCGFLDIETMEKL